MQIEKKVLRASGVIGTVRPYATPVPSL